LQPLTQMIVFTIFFGRLGGMSARTGGVPYPIYVYAGLLPWTFFQNSLSGSAGPLGRHPKPISKVYLPPPVSPVASIVPRLVDFAVSFVVLLGLMAYYQTALSWQLLLAPLLLAGTVIAATGAGTLLAALTVAYRDFRYVVPFMLQIWMFLTPVIYPLTIVPA